jgi:hypothetical protein
MSVTFNNSGTLLYALRRRLPPVLFKFNQSRAFCQFDAENYVNLCTMKAGCFVGDCDQVFSFASIEKIVNSLCCSILHQGQMILMFIFGVYRIMMIAVSFYIQIFDQNLSFHHRNTSTTVFFYKSKFRY